MSLSPCSVATDLHQRELAEHGSIAFPIACYHDNLPLQAVPWHWHDEWEFAIVSEGSVDFLLENVRLRLTEGEGIFINALALHGVEPVQGPGRLHSAVFHARLIGGSADSYFYQNLVQPMKDSPLRYVHLQPENSWQNQVLQGFHAVWYAMLEEAEDYEDTVRYHLSHAIRILLQNCAVHAALPSAQEQTDAARIRSMLEFIEAHYQEDLTIEHIAGQISVSSSVCLRCFHRMLGTTPMQYVRQLRLNKAAEQLVSGSRPIREIALDCGFNDISYFSKSFREKTGLTPKAYRQSRKKI